MADTVIYVRDIKTAQLIPIKATDNGDGTWNAGVVTVIAEINNKVVE